MTPDRARSPGTADPANVRAAFDAVHETPPAGRPAALDALRARDPAVAERVAGLLAALDAAPEFLEAPIDVDPVDVDTALATLTGSVPPPVDPAPGGHASGPTPGPDPGPGPDLDRVPTAAGMPPASLVPGHRLIRALAGGGSGIVYEAEQARPRRRVAIKLLRNRVPHPSDRRRFEVEAELLARMSHPGIAPVHAAGLLSEADGGTPWISMELVEDARSITAFCRERDLDVAARVDLVVTVAAAVQHAHGHGVIHRDLKPGNVLVDAAGRPRVIDFGIAVAAGDPDPPREAGPAAAARSEPTVTGTWVGTPGYMSPEQLTGGRRDLDVRADVYGLGVILYELLTGRLPHDLDGRPLHEMARIIVEEDPVPPRRREPAIDADLEPVVLKAIARDRTDRYGSIPEFVDDLRRWRRREPVSARPPTVGYRTRSFVRRHRGPVIAAAAGVAGLVLAVVLVTGLWLRSEETLADLSSRRAERTERARAERTAGELAALQARLEAVGGDDAASVDAIAGGVVDQVRRTVRDGAGPEARRSVIAAAVRTLRRLETEVAGRSELRAALSDAYMRLGTVQGLAWTAAPDEVAPSVPAFRRAVDLRAALSAEAPDDADHLARLADARVALGQAQRKLGMVEPALAAGAAAVADAERAFELDPSLANGTGLVAALWLAGDAAITVPEERGALAASRRAADLAARMRTAFGDRPETLELTAWSALRLALWLQRDPDRLEDSAAILLGGAEDALRWARLDGGGPEAREALLVNAWNAIRILESRTGPARAARFAETMADRLRTAVAEAGAEFAGPADPPAPRFVTTTGRLHAEFVAAAIRLHVAAADLAAEPAAIDAAWALLPRLLAETAADAGSLTTAAVALDAAAAPPGRRDRPAAPGLGSLIDRAVARADAATAAGDPAAPNTLADLAELLGRRGRAGESRRIAGHGLDALDAGVAPVGMNPEDDATLRDRLTGRVAPADPR